MDVLGPAAIAVRPTAGTDEPIRPPRRRHPVPPAVVAIGASTGGPQALIVVISGLAPVLPLLPVCVTLHMPADLMPVIAAHVARTCNVPVRVVTEPRVLERGTVYFAPGDRHLAFRRAEQAVWTELRIGPSQEACRAAIDVMFTSAATCYGPRVLGVVLSGMGKDGLAGSRAIVAAGGGVLVQDKVTSAVWGMPGSVAKANLAAEILTPAGIAREVTRRLSVQAATNLGRSA